MTVQKVKLPPKALKTFAPARGSVQYRGLHGGRGSAKSRSAAKMAAIWGMVEPLRILCTREYQVSIAESFHQELKDAIASEKWLEEAYEVGKDYLRGKNGTQFIFRGLRRNTQSVKSLANIDLTIVEEAEDVPEDSWLALEATVFRRPSAELWPIWNPMTKGSPVDSRFRITPPPNAIITEMNHSDNTFFPHLMELLRQREEKRLDPATYAWVWEGAYLEHSERQVFHGKWRVDDFTSEGKGWDGPYQGLDFGFHPDPLHAVRIWREGDKRLYIEYEASGQRVELDKTKDFLEERIPDFHKYTTRADSAEPKTISYHKRHGMPKLVGVKKWPNSVEEGVRYLRGYEEIVIHPRCKETRKDFTGYSHEVNKAGDILRGIAKGCAHAPDASRYAIQPLIQPRRTALQGKY